MRKWGLIHLKKRMKGRNFKYRCSSWLCLFIPATPSKHVNPAWILTPVPMGDEPTWTLSSSRPSRGDGGFVSPEETRVTVSGSGCMPATPVWRPRRDLRF